MNRPAKSLIVLVMVLAAGTVFSCGKRSGFAPMSQSREPAPAPPSDKLAAAEVSLDGQPKAGGEGGPGSDVGAKKAMPRKIIRDGEISLVVKAYDPVRKAIESMVEKSRGYIASSNVQHSLGKVSSATLVIRIPARRFPGVMKTLGALGVVQRESTNSKDITEQYYDLTARLSNARKLEKRFLDLLEKHTSKVSDLLQVEKELARVRGQIEVFQGKLRLFDNLVDMSKITISLSIQQKYTPPKPPSLLNDMGRVLDDSLDTMKAFGRGLLLVAVAVAPWIVPPGLVIVIVAFLVVRRLRRGSKKSKKSKKSKE